MCVMLVIGQCMHHDYVIKRYTSFVQVVVAYFT